MRRLLTILALTAACTAAQIHSAETAIESACPAADTVSLGGYPVGAVGCGLASLVDGILHLLPAGKAQEASAQVAANPNAPKKALHLRGKVIGHAHPAVHEHIQCHLDALAIVDAGAGD